MSFYIDNAEIDLPCSIDRVAELTASEVSGILLDKSYFNDVLGTYMKYTISVAIPAGREGTYEILYEALTEPVDGHTFILPYNQDVIELTGRINTISDRYYREEDGVKIWRGTKFEIIANHPSKTMSLDDVIARGLAPIPDVMNPQIGDVYEFLSSGWDQIEISGNDETEY